MSKQAPNNSSLNFQTIIDSIKNSLSQIFNFNGKTGRQDFWIFFFANLVVALLLSGFISSFIHFFYFGYLTSFIVNLILCIPSFAIAVRRLHDTNKSGWFLLLGLIPLAGIIILIIFWAQPSVKTNNKY